MPVRDRPECVGDDAFGIDWTLPTFAPTRCPLLVRADCQIEDLGDRTGSFGLPLRTAVTLKRYSLQQNARLRTHGGATGPVRSRRSRVACARQ